jgi:glycosyltransferase involved in cell wall biosynthesis
VERGAESQPTVALLQRAIPHYRLPLFKKLAAETPFRWIFYCSDHDDEVSTGLPASDLNQLQVRPINNRRLLGPFIYQTGVKLHSDGVAAFMLDLGWTLVSTPRYLIEAKMRGIATVGWSKGIPQNAKGREGPLKRLYQKFILGLCDVVIVYGKISKDYFRKLGFPEERIFIAQNTIDSARIARELPLALSQRKKLLERLPVKGRFVFGYMGALVPRKKVECIIEAFSRVRSAGVDALLVLAGTGLSEHALRELVAANPYRTDILLVGRVPVGEEGGYFQLFDVYLSFAQGGLGILEAMAHGRAVVSTPEKYPETELLIDEESALLANDFTVEAFARRMCFAVEHRDRLAAIGARARERVLQEATLENMVKAITSAVQVAITRHHTR